MNSDKIQLRDDQKIGTINPEVYGHFIEHLGGAVYGGIWVGDDAQVEHEDGIRSDVLDLMNEISPPVLRWPGGCFADYYHWEDGLGDREDRPRRLNVFWDGEETNEFGTEEFLRLCRLVDAEPFLALNLGSGSVEEAIKWVEYCNYEGDTEYTQLRAENGHPDPHEVKYWAIGNESWGCGGEDTPEGYAREFRRYGNYLRALEDRFPTSMELVGVGHAPSVAWSRRYDVDQFALNDYDWNTQFLQNISKPDYSFSGTQFEILDHLSIHRYVQSGDDVDFTDQQYYRIFDRARKIGEDIDHSANVLRTYLPERDVGIVVDEWGVWHPQFDPQQGEYHQESTVRDAIVAASILDQFNNRADVVKMANIAMTTNILHCLVQTNEEQAWTTPTYRVFKMYMPHMGAQAIETSIQTGKKEVEYADDGIPFVSASASVQGDNLYVTASNRSLDNSRQLEIDADLHDGEFEAAGQVLFDGLSPETYSTASTAADELFSPGNLSIEKHEESVIMDLPPSSVCSVKIVPSSE